MKTRIVKAVAFTCVALSVMCQSALWSAAKPAVSKSPWPKWIEKEKIRAGCDFDWVDSRDHLANLKAHGFNTILLMWDGDIDQPQAIQLLKKQAGWCKDLGLHLLVVVKLCGGKDQLRFLTPEGRCYTAANGTRLTKTPCPADSGFWGKSVTRRCRLAADLSRSYSAIDGFVIDDEMYGADNANFPGYCYCDWCVKEFLASKIPPGKVPAGMQASERYGWLEKQGLLDRFQKRQDGAVEANARTTEQTAHKIAPDFILGCFHLDQLSFPRPSWARGLGTQDMPVLALPESTYPSGATPYLTKIPGMLTAVGAHAKFAPGIWPRHFAVDALASHLFYSAQGPAGKYGPQTSSGYWIWTTLAFAKTQEELGGPNSDYTFPLPHEPWLSAIQTANDELDRQAREGVSFVPRLELKHKQDSPQVALEKIGLWGPAKVSLRPLVASGKQRVEGEQKESARLRYQSAYYILAATGETIRGTLNSVRMGDDGMQPPVYALTSPSGKVAAQGKVEPGQTVPLAVTAEESGLYKLALSIEQHATSVAIATPHAVLSLAEGVCMMRSSVRLYFYVPSNVEQFTIEVATPYAAEQAKLVVWNPGGSEAASAQTLELTPARVAIEVKPEHRGRVWSFQSMPADRGQYYSANVTLDAKLPQYLAESPEALLVPVDAK